MPAGCKPIPGMGNGNLMFVGELPSKDDSILEEPVSGQPGQLLEKILNSSGLSREKVYTTLGVKCFSPGKPKAAEKAMCNQWLAMEIAEIDPKIIFPMGKAATNNFVKVKQADNLADFVGKEFNFCGIKIVPLYSMSYLLQHSSAEVQETVEVIRRYVNG